MQNNFRRNPIYITLFAVSFAFVEAAVVVYLRDLYYPQGFHFPLKMLIDRNLIIELIREFTTIVMMASVAGLAGRKFWERFGYFLIIFGVWDICFYVWLKAALGWSESPFTWDVLFLLPAPWLGPVLAPILVSATMIFIGVDITRRFAKGIEIRPRLIHWLGVLAGSALVLYSFMNDTAASLHEQMPQPYKWEFFLPGLALYLITYIHLIKQIKNKT